MFLVFVVFLVCVVFVVFVCVFSPSFAHLLLIRHLLQLPHRVDEHVQALERGDGGLEVALGVVELPDVGADHLDHALGPIRLGSYVLNFRL